MPIAFVIPGDIDLPTGGYAYDRRVLAEAARAGVTIEHVRLAASFPSPSAADIAETQRRLHALPPDHVLLIDGLAYGAFPECLLGAIRQPIVALVHHPLGLEAGLTAQRQRALLASERAALAYARHVLVNSPTTARTLVSDFAVPAADITVAIPGTDAAARAAGADRSLQLLAVGSIVPRKGYEVLVQALASCRHLDWRLTIVGAARDAAAETALHSAITTTGLAGRITVAGALSNAALDAAYAAADLFVMPSLYEGFGMVLTEALARGLPIVCTTGGAAAETVPDAAALKVAPGDATALGHAIRRLLADAALRRQLSDNAWAAAAHLQRWDETARIVVSACEKARTS